jgi:divalent metal cation (Fe/Co/Zn/Cd) transporter
MLDQLCNQCSPETHRLYRKGLRLEYFSIGYNVTEAIVSIVFGTIAGSIALIGFGLDSIVESLSAGALIWRLRQHGHISQKTEERIEKRVVKLVTITFLILGVYVLVESIRKLTLAEIPAPSFPGIVIAIVSLAAMPVVAWQKRNIGRRIGSRALVADSKETLACTFLSLALLLGLGANYLWGFWQADPVVGFIIVAFLFREGWHGLREAREEGHD